MFFNKKTDSGKWVLLIPIFVCSLAVFPGINQIFIALENKLFDSFFHFYPPHAGYSPAVVIAKDQSTLDFLGREPDRKDLSQILRRLASSGVKVAAIDFIYDSPKSPETDLELASALDLFPGMVIAERFKPRTAISNGMETIQIIDENAQRPPWPLPLYEPIASRAKERGLVNIFRDQDGVIRILPLAFFPDEMTEFRPGLAFSAWLSSLLANAQKPSFSEIPQFNNEGQNFEEAAISWIISQFQKSPHRFTGFGHLGLNQLFRRREVRWLAFLAIEKVPGPNPEEAKNAWLKAADQIDLKRLPDRSWVDTSDMFLPIVGASNTPCLRVPFTKATFTSDENAITDGIPVFSFKTILESFDRKSDSIVVESSGNSDGLLGEKPLVFDFASAGSNALSGQCLSISGTPQEGILAFCEQQNGGFWATSTSNLLGQFEFKNLPTGTYSVELIKRHLDGVQRLKLETPIFCSSGEGKLPVAYFLPQDLTVKGKVQPSFLDRKIVLEGDGVWVGFMGTNEAPHLASIPSGFNFIPLDSEDTLVSNKSWKNVGFDGRMVPGKKVALVEDVPSWKGTFFSSSIVKNGQTDFALSGLCPALGAKLILKETGNPKESAQPMEVDLCVGTLLEISSAPPALSVPDSVEVSFPFRFPKDFSSEISIWLQTQEFNWLKCSFDKIGKIKIPTGNYRVFAESKNKRGRLDLLSSQLSGTAVFIGTHLMEDQDFYVTPVNFMDSSLKPIPGVNLHARLFSTLSKRQFLKPTFLHMDFASWKWPFLTLIIIFPLIMVCEKVFRKKGAVIGGTLVILFALAWITGSIILFRFHWLVPAALPIIMFSLYGSARGYQAYSDSHKLEQQTRSTFERFVSARMVEDILRNPEILKPGGEKKELTIMFTDLAGFTSISEALPAEELVQLMNEYLGEMTGILFEYGGTLDKYIGDAIMGFWNYPALQADHALRACKCAIAMQRRLKVLQMSWKEKGLPLVSMRAGINTSECIVGFIGSKIQMNFTCMGDGVNLSSRLEGANKAYHTLMMVSETTLLSLEPAKIRTRFLDFLSVKGKEKPVKVYELIGEIGEDDDFWNRLLPIYSSGIDFYLKQDWEKAKIAFQEMLRIHPDDGPALTYIDRCSTFQENPPDAGWDGRFILKTK